MNSLIEQAALRLQQLREAGADVPELPPMPVDAPTVREHAPERAASAQPSPRVELDLAALAAAGLVAPGGERSQLADQFRLIKRPVLANAAGKGAAPLVHGNLVMVTSALPGEGKSFTAVNLAMSMADELDHTVMLVDADVARPSIPRMLGFEPGKGLLDVLQGRADVAEVLLRTNVPKLSLLPSGTPDPKATELLASQAMKQLLDDIALRYHDRVVIFDSPPLLLTTEARVLASHMGQIIVVVQAGVTLQSDVQSALASIEKCPVRLLLLNQARADRLGKAGYGYGYGYGQGYGSSSSFKYDGQRPRLA